MQKAEFLSSGWVKSILSISIFCLDQMDQMSWCPPVRQISQIASKYVFYLLEWKVGMSVRTFDLNDLCKFFVMDFEEKGP